MAVESLFSTIHCSLFFRRAERTSLVCVAFRSFLLSIVEHILLLYDNASSHELHNYCARVGDKELDNSKLGSTQQQKIC